MRMALRIAGLVFLAIAFVFLVIDGTMSLAANAPVISSTAAAWTMIDGNGPATVEAMVKASVPGFVWDDGLGLLLMVPGWLLFGVPGAAMVYAGRPRRFGRSYSAI
ncbi:MAG TPA: hypothetical protein VIL84_00005 [Devosiaceae bacterium]